MNKSPPHKQGANTRIVGEKNSVRTANEPDRFLTEPPNGVVPESPLKGLCQIHKCVVPRREPNPIEVWMHFSTHRTGSGAKGNSTMAAVSHGRRGVKSKGHQKEATREKKGCVV